MHLILTEINYGHAGEQDLEQGKPIQVTISQRKRRSHFNTGEKGIFSS